MPFQDLLGCFVCLLLAGALVAAVVAFVKFLTNSAKTATGNNEPSPEITDSNRVFDRVMQIRRLFASLPDEHWPRVLTRLYDDLHEKNQISAQQCSELKQALPSPMATLEQPDLAATARPPARNRPTSPAAHPGERTPELPDFTPIASPISNIDSSSPTTSRAPQKLGATGVASPEPEIITASLAPPATATATRTVPSQPSLPAAPLAPAPWQMPDPPPRAPRQSLAQWSQSFMEERNIHWGELASGILIVGSALGLVISLRRELQDTIPYFPALLFLLISLAVHYAGVYTLQRWRLRSTSRGLLLISLLLVPLNFLAGVLFNADTDSRRPLADPWLWIAVVTGTIGTGWITWSAARFLLRKGHAALFIPVMITGLGIVVLNRMPAAQADLTRGWTLLPIAIVLATIYGAFAWKLTKHQRASAYTSTRVWILAGITLFSLGNVYALYLMKQPTEPQLLSSLSPASAVWVLALLWLLVSLNRSLTAPALMLQRLIGQGLTGLLWFTLAALLAWTVRCPRDLLSIMALYSVAALGGAWHFRRYAFVPLSAGCGLIAALLARGFTSGTVNWTDQISGGELLDLLINGRSAVMFLIVGGILSAASPLLQQYFSSSQAKPPTPDLPTSSPTSRQIRRWNSLTSIGFVGFGSVLALIGAYRPNADFWDAMIGTILLFAVSLFVVGTALWGGYRRVGKTALTVAGSLLTIAASFEACFGNHYLVTSLQEAGWNQRLQGELAVAISLSVLAIAAMLQNRRSQAHADEDLATRWAAEPTVRFSAIGIILGHVGVLVAIVGLILDMFSLPGVILGSVLFVGGMSAVVSHPNYRQLWCETLTLTGLFFFSGLYFQSNTGQSLELGSGTWAFCFAGVLAVWCLAMPWMAARFWRNDWQSEKWQTPIMPRDFVVAAVPLLLLAMVSLSLADAVKREVWAVAPTWLVPSWQMSELVNLATAVLAAWSLLLFAIGFHLRTLKRTSRGIASSECLILGTILFMSILLAQGARWDTDVRTASAIRWLLAAGSLLIAVIPWCWSALRVPLAKQPDAKSLAPDESTNLSPRAFWLDPSARLRIVYSSIIAGVFGVFLLTGIAVTGFLTVGPSVKGLSPQVTWLGHMRTDVSYGIPVAILLAAVLLHGISQRQRVLTIAGSYLLRSIVAFQLVLLIVSPHPQLATEWFIHIVQMVSAGMTLYGWGWYLNRRQCATEFTPGHWLQPIQMHAWFNGALVAGLMLLVIGKYLLAPVQPLGWIQSAGNLVGLFTIVLYLPLAWIVLLRGTKSSWFVPVTIVAVAIATMLVVNIERWASLDPGVAFIILGWLWVVIAVGLAIAHWIQPLPTTRFAWSSARIDVAVAWTMISSLIVSYSWQGFDWLTNEQWHFFGMHAALLLIGIILGAARQSLIVSFFLVPLTSVWLWRADLPTPVRILPNFLENTPSLHLTLAVLIGTAWLTGNLIWRFVARRSGPRWALLFGRLSLGAALFCLLSQQLFRFPKILATTDLVLLATCSAYLVASLWCARERWRIGAWAAYHLILFAAIASGLATWLQFSNAQHAIGWWIASGIVVMVWGAAMRYWPANEFVYRQLRIPRLAATRRSQLQWLPLAASLVAGGLVLIVTAVQFSPFERWERQLACMAPLLTAIGFVWIANATRLAWQQYAAISLMTLSAVLLSWTNVPRENAETWYWGLLVQTYWVLGVGYLIYGFAVAHWLRTADTWRTSAQQSALAMLGLATTCLLLIVTDELANWANSSPVNSTAAQASLIGGMSIALAISLIVVALVPKHQAVAQNMMLRQAHVYAAQGLLTISIVHTAITMPWLFRFGLQQYWPYIAMGLAFAGIGVWHLLQKRRLIVLAEPLATSLMFFPAIAALLALGLQSQSDRSLVMLLAGLVYGALAVTHPGFWTRFIALAFGNLALWLFIERYPLWSFQIHPQLWLIPPAVTALIISRIEQQRLGKTAATSIRYLALAVIYVSSTSEIFIQGIGKNLAPPMILATLALLGMFAGMALKIREYIFLGALFLLVAMFTMVWHAQQQLNHVWPWWAFGISLGIATLVFFAIFEQRRNQQRRLGQSNSAAETKDPAE